MAPFFTRILVGQTVFFLLRDAAPMIPISLVMVCYTLSPFWTLIVARLMLDEIIVPLEIIASIVCFSMVVILAWQEMKQEFEDP